ncbi:MAG: M12 family metallo-peptidase, partial [Bacteroidota bacterium]|nr:M12 family metallo-peptidase [Bacteroidota bacterium]
MITRTVSVIMLVAAAFSGFSQTWSVADPPSIQTQGIRDIVPDAYLTYTLDVAAIKQVLWSAPDEYLTPVEQSQVLLTVALANGESDVFKIVEYEIMEIEEAALFPEIKTFIGVSISNPYRRMHADWTTNGFRAVIRDLEGVTYIDPFQRNDLSHRIVYRKSDSPRIGHWTCSVEDDPDIHSSGSSGRAFGDCMFRSYRLALATTGEYSNFFGATSSSQQALVMSQVITAINRVNEVYEQDVTARLILVANTHLLFYYAPGSDPYTNNNGSTMLGENQTNVTAVIGSANYDIGHVFSTGGGGVAVLGSVCNTSSKAQGVTGSSNPVGDGFTIDYV